MSQVAKVHLFSGFLGVGKTTVLKGLMHQKPTSEKWVVIVNEFGEIGIDGAVLTQDDIPIAEIVGGCLCCVAGPQMTITVAKLLRQHRPDRLLIEASGLAHAATVINELKRQPLGKSIVIGTIFTMIDPRQFMNPEYEKLPLYQDQVNIADVLMVTKIANCDALLLADFYKRIFQVFPSKAKIIEVGFDVVQKKPDLFDLACLEIETIVRPSSKYQVMHPIDLSHEMKSFQSEGFIFDEAHIFIEASLLHFFNKLPKLCSGLVRAKGVFRVLDKWLWINWVADNLDVKPIAWSRDSRFELIAQEIDAPMITQHLNACYLR